MYKNSHVKAVMKYDEKNYKTFTIKLRSKEFTTLQTAVETSGISRNKFITDAIREKIAKMHSE